MAGIDASPAFAKAGEKVVTVSATLGDTIEATVVVTNAGPRTATAFEVRDTVPSALTYVSSSQTGGSYDAGTGLWSFDSLDAGAADTLRVLLEVTDGTPGTVPLTAESLGLTFEIDSNPGNDEGTVDLEIVDPTPPGQ